MNTEIEFFKNVTNRDNHSVQSLDKLLTWSTTNENLRQRTDLYRKFINENLSASKQDKSTSKVKYFPAVTFAGTFKGTGTAKDILTLSGLIVLDIDHIANMQETRQLIKNDKYTYLVFTSPSGDGLKVIIKHTLTEPNEWKYMYNELESYYKTSYNIETDKSGKDISRMCFIPFIDGLYQNNNSEIWQYKGIPEDQIKETNRLVTKDITALDANELYKKCYYLASYLYINKIDITVDFDDWVLLGYSLCYLGEEQGKEIYNIISMVNSEYNAEQTENKFNYYMQNYDSTKTGIEFYMKNAKSSIVDYQLFKQFGYNA